MFQCSIFAYNRPKLKLIPYLVQLFDQRPPETLFDSITVTLQVGGCVMCCALCAGGVCYDQCDQIKIAKCL